MSRKTKDWNWTLDDDKTKGSYSSSSAQLSVLMDIRDELKLLNNRVTRPELLQAVNLA